VINKMVYHISYDLNKPGQNYNELYSEIKSLGSWCHPADSTWYVDTNLSATQIRDRLDAVDATDSLIVSRASAPAAWIGLPNDVSDWLEACL